MSRVGYCPLAIRKTFPLLGSLSGTLTAQNTLVSSTAMARGKCNDGRVAIAVGVPPTLATFINVDGEELVRK